MAGDVVGRPCAPERHRGRHRRRRCTSPRASASRAIGVSTNDGGMVFTVMPCAGELAGERLGEADHPALRRRVVRHVRRARLRARRRDGDDATPAGVDHVGERGLDARERAGEVHADDARPRLRRDVGAASKDSMPADVTTIPTGPSSVRTRSKASATADQSATSTSTASARGALVAQFGGGGLGGVAVTVEERDRVSVARRTGGRPRARCRRPPRSPPPLGSSSWLAPPGRDAVHSPSILGHIASTGADAWQGVRVTAPRRLGAPESKTRARLLDAAEQLILREGYAAVTSRRVAAEAGIKPALVHYYFRAHGRPLPRGLPPPGGRGMERFVPALEVHRSLRTLWRFGTDLGGAT